MNRSRRRMLVEAIALLEQLQEDVQSIRDEEDEALGNLAESLASGERGLAMADAVEKMDDAIDGLSEVIGALAEAGS